MRNKNRKKKEMGKRRKCKAKMVVTLGAVKKKKWGKFSRSLNKRISLDSMI